MLMVGSQALQNNGFIIDRPIVDVDYIATLEEIQSFCKIFDNKISYPLSNKKWILKLPNVNIFEFEIAWPGSTAEELHKMFPSTPNHLAGVSLASPEVCLALKLSHRYLKNSPHFLKTMEDIWMLRKAGVTVSETLKPWLERREKETYSYQHPNLKRTKQEFFTSSVNYIYDHDSIHESVKHLEKPAYKYYATDNEEIHSSKQKFLEADIMTRLYGVLEESYVLALERSLIPYPNKKTPREAFLVALMKVCTSITSGFFREFAWENYYHVVTLYDDRYYSNFQRDLQKGNIKCHNSH